MKTNSKPQTRHPPTLTAHISFGEVGLGPDSERFIRVNIDIAKQRRIVLLRYDDFVNGSGYALARLNAFGAHLISPPAKSELLRRLQDLGPREPSFHATRVGPFGKAFARPGPQCYQGRHRDLVRRRFSGIPIVGATRRNFEKVEDACRAGGG